MSRRKQAKPRSLKREDLQSFVEEDESTQDTVAFSDTKEESLAEDRFETSSVVSDPSLDEEDEEDDACGSCKFETLSEYLEQHDCVTGGGSSCGGSVRSSSTPDDLPEGDSEELAFTVGVTETTPYGCQFCDKAFPRLSYLKRHEQIHSDQMPFRCDYCQRLFKHKRSRDRHVKLHTGDRKYRCTQCESAFSRSDHLKIHLRTHDNGKPYQCAVCNRGYNTAAALSSHMQNHKGTRAETAVSSEQIVDMRNGDSTPDPPKQHPLPSSPSLPHRSSFSSSSPLSAESPRPSSSSARPCFKCLDELSSPNAVCTHKKCESADCDPPPKSSRFSPMSSKQLQCGFCSKCDFPSFESLQLHVQVMHVPQHDPSAALAASFRSLQNAFHGGKRLPYDNFMGYSLDGDFSALHLLQKHASLGDPSLLVKRPSDIYCSQCNIGFTTSAALLDHVHAVHETGPASPHGHTGKRSRLRPNGVKHLKTSHSFNGTSHFRRQDPGGGQTGPSPDPTSATLLCSQCSAGFLDFESFRSHLKSHLEQAAPAPHHPQPPHPCGECGARLPSAALLDSHVAGHFLSAATEYGCGACVKLFPKADDLQRHLMEVHAHHLYRCALCKQVFDSKVSIQVHFAVKHSDEHRSLKCTSCHAYFRSEMEFQLHVKLNHLPTKTTNSYHSATTFRCLLCDQSFSSEPQLRLHTATHRKEFVCQECGEAFHVEFLLDKHVQAAHQVASSLTSSGVSEEAQNLCTKKTNGPSGATGQTSPSTDLPKPTTPTSPKPQSPTNIPHRCDICDVTCSSDVALTSHRRQAHRLQQKEQLQHCKSNNGGASSAAVSLFCAYCNESCKSRGELENHMKAHTATPSKHKCNICDEICPSATTLAEHKLTHCKVVSGSTCLVCRAHLSSEDHFISHVQQHGQSSPNTTNGLPVPCVICRQTLVVDIEVKMHARFHLANNELANNNNELSSNNNCYKELNNKSCLNELVAKSNCYNELPTNYSELGKNNCYNELGNNELSSPCCVCGRLFDPGHLIIRASKDPQSHTYMCKGCFHSEVRCGDCGVKFESHAEVEAHRKSAHSKQTFQCIKCQVSFETEQEVEKHVKCHVMNEGTSHECRLCHEVLSSPSKLQCHLIEHSFEGSTHFTCYLCSAVFASSSLLQRHMFEHGLDSRPYDCLECGHKFFFRAELENHAFVHTWDKRKKGDRSLFECPLCPCVFGGVGELANHRRTHDLKLEVLSCPSCGLEFASAEELMAHITLLHPNSIATADRVSLHDFYKFEEDKSSDEKGASKSHFKTKKSFECPVCKKRFTRKENKKLHMKSHHSTYDSQKTLPCTQCEKVFQKRTQLKEHTKKEHSQPTNHKCEVCEDPLPSTNHLRKHLRDVHSRTFEYTCVVCDEPFDDERQMLEHQDEQHQVRVEVTEETLIEPKTEIESCPASPTESSTTITDDQSPELKHDRNEPDYEEPVQTSYSELTMEASYNGQEERTHLPAEVVA